MRGDRGRAEGRRGVLLGEGGRGRGGRGLPAPGILLEADELHCRHLTGRIRYALDMVDKDRKDLVVHDHLLCNGAH